MVAGCCKACFLGLEVIQLIKYTRLLTHSSSSSSYWKELPREIENHARVGEGARHLFRPAAAVIFFTAAPAAVVLSFVSAAVILTRLGSCTTLFGVFNCNLFSTQAAVILSSDPAAVIYVCLCISHPLYSLLSLFLVPTSVIQSHFGSPGN